MENQNQENKRDFYTHYNYIDCLDDLIGKASIKCSTKLNRGFLPDIKTKENLINLTKRSLEDEYDIVQIDKGYSYASTSWLPIKSYYLIFNQLLTISYIFSKQKKSFSMTHRKCIEQFTTKLKRGEIRFNNPILNQVMESTIFSHSDAPGSNMDRRISLPRRYDWLMGKIAEYKLLDWKKKNNVDNFRTKINQDKKKDYLSNFNLSIFEFPYYMRIRSNYRDFAFIDGVSDSETAKYFYSYYNFTMNFYDILVRLEKDLLVMRGVR